MLNTKPYENSCIISVIRQMFFTKKSSVSTRHDSTFVLMHEGKAWRTIPAPMLALVATAVSPNVPLSSVSG